MRGVRNQRFRIRRSSQSLPKLATVQMLEQRALLAGNAIASLNGPHLTVLGDTDSNSLEITVLGGNVIVRGLDDTTVNGAAEFVVATGSNTIAGNIFVSLGDGDDTLLFSRNVNVSGKTDVRGGSGDDSIGAINAVFGAGLDIHGKQGSDTISIQETTVTGRLWMKTRSGDDVISITDTTVNGRLKIKSGVGSDAISITNTSVSHKFSIHAGSGQDDISLRDSTFSSLVKMRTRADADAVLLEGNTFEAPVRINNGRNDDSVLVRSGNTFNSLFKVYGGDGNNDAVEIEPDNIFNGGQKIKKVESGTVSPTIVSQRFDDADTGVIARGEAADEFFRQLLVLNPQDLTLDTSSNTGVLSTGDVLITRNSDFQIDGTATPRSTIDVDTDGDGEFDDGSTIADDDGNFSITVTLERLDLFGDTSTGNDELDGFQTITVRATDEGGGEQTASTSADYVVNTVVQFVSNFGSVEVELFDGVTPNTVSNFLGYLTRYTNSFIHRSVADFVVQGGGFVVENGVITEVPTDAPITNEYSDQTSNIRRTLSMAQLGGDINSGTSQWFFNTVDNTSLDDVPHTVFGRVVGEGMEVVDEIASQSIFDLADASGLSALNSVPQRAPFIPLSEQVLGTLSTTSGDTTITGTGTQFTQQLTSIQGNPDGSRSRISLNGEIFEVDEVISDTELRVTAAPAFSIADAQARTDLFIDDDFVRFSAIQEILETP